MERERKKYIAGLKIHNQNRERKKAMDARAAREKARRKQIWLGLQGFPSQQAKDEYWKKAYAYHNSPEQVAARKAARANGWPNYGYSDGDH
jgi:hypothetical protein